MSGRGEPKAKRAKIGKSRCGTHRLTFFYSIKKEDEDDVLTTVLSFYFHKPVDDTLEPTRSRSSSDTPIGLEFDSEDDFEDTVRPPPTPCLAEIYKTI